MAVKPNEVKVLFPVNSFIGIARTSNQGLGVFALCDLETTFNVVDEQYVLRMPWKRSISILDEKLAALMLEQNLAAASAETRASFESLHGGSLIEKFIHNNSLINTDDNPWCAPSDKCEAGIYLTRARLNHSCVPNCVSVEEGGVMSIVTQKDIKSGEQLTISYIQGKDILLPTVARARSLSANSRIDRCLCALCLAPEAEKRRSDANRTRMASLYDRIISPRGTLIDFNDIRELAITENVPLSSLGGEFGQKMYQMSLAFSISPSTIGDTKEISSTFFRVGNMVRLHKLVARTDLNGRCGVVIKLLGPEVGRCGIALLTPERAKLDASEAKILNIKFENLLLLPK